MADHGCERFVWVYCAIPAGQPDVPGSSGCNVGLIQIRPYGNLTRLRVGVDLGRPHATTRRMRHSRKGRTCSPPVWHPKERSRTRLFVPHPVECGHVRRVVLFVTRVYFMCQKNSLSII